MTYDEGIKGQRFGKLVIISRDKIKRGYWECLCDCGKSKSIYLWSMKSGATKSCGCGHREIISKNAGDVAYLQLYNRSKFNSDSRGYGFELTKEQHRYLISNNCSYCGAEPIPYNPYCRKGETTSRRVFRYDQDSVDRAWVKVNGIDRVNSSVGYVFDNCVSCCILCNISKLQKTPDEFINHAYKIVNYQNSKT